MKRPVRASQKPRLLPPVRPSAATEQNLYKMLTSLIDEMQKSVLWWVSAAYRAKPPAMAQDGSAKSRYDGSTTVVMQRILNRLTRKWTRKFNEAAPALAEHFTTAIAKRNDKALAESLAQSGVSVEMKMTAPVKDALQSSMAQQVILIKDLGKNHMMEISESVMRSVSVGGDLKTLTDELKKRYGITHRRAKLIARDQNSKATATINKARQESIGITEAVWKHSHAGKVPRPSHVAADGTVYKVKDGLVLDGERVWPGTAINCFPGDSVVSNGEGLEKLFRRRYSGQLALIVTEAGKTIKATPNHPILTDRGWIPANQVQAGDHVFNAFDESANAVEGQVETRNAEFSKAFDSAAFYIGLSIAGGSELQFHGDGSNEEIHVVDFDRFLPDEVNASVCQDFCEFFFARADHYFISATSLDATCAPLAPLLRLLRSSQRDIRCLGSIAALIERHLTHADDVCLGGIAKLYAILCEATTYRPATNAVFFGEGENAHPAEVVGNKAFIGKMLAIVARASGFSASGDHADTIDTSSLVADRVVSIGVEDFSGHVFNLETMLNWYSVSARIVHNCRCFSRSILPSMVAAA